MATNRERMEAFRKMVKAMPLMGTRADEIRGEIIYKRDERVAFLGSVLRDALLLRPLRRMR